mgnify:CR=1 FL=1
MVAGGGGLVGLSLLLFPHPIPHLSPHPIPHLSPS